MQADITKIEQRSIRTFWNIAALLLAISTSAAQSKTPVIDLTRPMAQLPRNGERPLGVPGAGINSSKPSSEYDLPLAIRLISVRSRDGNTSVLRLVLHNAGSTVYSFPIGRDSNELLAQGSTGRRSLLFGAKAELPDGNTQDVGLGDVATSSANDSTVFRLTPGREVVVLLLVHLGALQETTARLQLFIEVTEMKFEDAEYRIAGMSKTVRSKPLRIVFRSGRWQPWH